MKLAAKLILVFLCGVFAIVMLFTWQTLRRQYEWEQQRRESHANDLVDAITPEIVRAYRDGGTVTIKQAVEVSAHTVSGSQMRWVEGSEAPQSHMQITSRKISSVSVEDADGTRTAYSYVPLTVDGQRSGAIEIAQPMADEDAFTRSSVVASILSLLGVAALSTVVIYFGGIQLVGRPLDKLIDQVNLIGEGNLAQAPVLSSNDELGKLAGAISQMSYRLSEQRDTIRHTDRLGTVGTLAAGVAHELGTPLNVVSGRAGLIASGKLSEQEVESSAKVIKSESDRMTAIIRQLLDFARQTPSPHEVVDVQEIATRTCDLMRPLARKSSVMIEMNGADEPIRVAGDAAQIQQVLTNLLSNAIAAMPSGGSVSVSLRPANETGYVTIQVTDSGAGIESEDIERIFEPFYTTKDVGQGTGLGLSISYGIVKEHGGQIKVTSEQGKQTTFTVLLPSARTDSTRQTPA